MPQPTSTHRIVYERHRPEETPRFRIVETYYPRFLARLEAEGGSLPAFVKWEFDDYLKCGRLEHGFLRVCAACSHEHLVAASCKRRGFCPSCGARRLNIHFHMLVLDGVYTFDRTRPRFHRAPRPTRAEPARLLHAISTCIARLLERRGLLVRDAGHDNLDWLFANKQSTDCAHIRAGSIRAAQNPFVLASKHVPVGYSS